MIKKIVKENLFYIFFIIFLVVLFAFIMNSSYYNKIKDFDYKIIEMVDNLINKNFTTYFKLATFIGDFYIPSLIIVCILLFIKNKWYLYILSLSYALAGIIAYVSKIITMRPRPLVALIRIPISYSFPSGHTLTALIFYSMLCYLLTIKANKFLKVILSFVFSIIIMSVALSRIYLGVHYFSDVVGGVLIGIPLLLMLSNIVEKHFKEKII